MSKDRYAISSLNPHTHAGCDNRYKCNYTRRRVSIHTPTQGVTKLRLLCFGSSWFQSTHPRRVWPSCWLLCIILIKFQSTHPRRVWLRSPDRISSPSKFQSTHPRRVWRTATWYLLFSRVSIHTPTQGVTGGLLGINDTWISFNPHTHAGCDCCNLFPFLVYSCFNPHTHAGCDPSAFPLNSRYSGFNPHTHAGCDLTENGFYICVNVSIHTPTQGVTNPRPTLYPIIPSFNPHTHAGCDLAISQTLAIWKFQSTHPRRVWLGWMTEHLCY